MLRISKATAAMSALFLSAATTAPEAPVEVPQRQFDLRSGAQVGFDFDLYVCTADGRPTHTAYSVYTDAKFLTAQIEKKYKKPLGAMDPDEKAAIKKAYFARMDAVVKSSARDFKKIVPIQEKVDQNPALLDPLEKALTPIAREFAKKEGWPFFSIEVIDVFPRLGNCTPGM